MPLEKVRQTICERPAGKASYARLTTLAKGRIIGLREEGVERQDIADRVRKHDGVSPSLRAIDDIYSRFLEDPDWIDDPGRAGGRPRDLTPKQEQKVKKILLRDAGKVKVTAAHVKRCLPELREMNDRTVTRTFDRLGYDYLYRRKKAAIGAQYKPQQRGCD